MEILGLDIGGSGIKGAIVETSTGELVTERYRLKTPKPATPKTVAETLDKICKHFKWKGPVGCGFPAAINPEGVALTASNIDKSWIGTNAKTLFSEKSGCEVFLGNDADVAALAEIKFGAGHGFDGMAIVITLGTGIGTGVVSNGRLVPNTELGHIYLSNGLTGERFAAESVMEKEDLNWEEWGKRVNVYLKELKKILYPDLMILGGGGGKKLSKFGKYLTVDCEVVQAELKNLAGIVGAALLAEAMLEKKKKKK